MAAVCDQFGDEIAFVMINDDISHNARQVIHPCMFPETFPQRMKRLIAPGKDMGKLVLMHTDGKLDKILPILYNVGININYPIEQESNDIFEVKQLWAGRMALIGNVRTPLARLWNEGTNRGSGQRKLPEIGPGRRLRIRLIHKHYGWHTPGKLRGYGRSGAQVWPIRSVGTTT
jgi:hypothetical protein